MQSLFGRNRQILAVAVYSAAVLLSFFASWILIEGRFPGIGDLLGLWWPAAVLLGTRLGVHRLHRLTMGRWRYVGIPDLSRLVSSATVGSAVFVSASIGGVLGVSLPLEFFVLEWVLTVFVTSAAWISYRVGFEILRMRSDPARGRLRRTLIVGAGESGSLLAREIGRAPTGLKVVGFVDDDPAKKDAVILGSPVLGTTSDLPSIVDATEAQLIVIAMPSAEPGDLRRIVGACEAAGVEFKVLPGIASVLAGDVSLRQLRAVTIEDLLGRKPVSLDLPELERDIRDGVVLVTGAAGSIGSELARQIAANAPARLVLFDQAESDLFFIEQELRQAHPNDDFVAIVGDVRNGDRFAEIVRKHEVTHIYHAAAYKHVPLMETNATEAVHNNVCGTKNVFDAAGRHGVRACVLISTDKAVNPSSVMGASKRVCELLLLDAVDRHPGTRFTAVRFGNVLGSNGSVVPIFRRQMTTGRLTVTHPDITRYFMTIPEAVQLVLSAAVLPEAGGRIAMLEMGEPVRIVDLARNMIRLSGLREDVDVRIEFTGLRPGEKLHEELVASSESTESTENGKIKLVRSVTDLDIEAGVSRLIRTANRGDSERCRALLFELATENPPVAAH